MEIKKEVRETKELYLDLMKRCLTNWMYGDKEEEEVINPKGFIRRKIVAAFANRGIRLVRPKPFDLKERGNGYDWPPTAHTMIGLKGLDNLQRCVEEVLNNNIPGDFIETGVWRGGASIFMRAILKAYEVRDRYVWLADSFQGLPPSNPDKYPCDKGDRHHTYKYLAVSLEEVKANFERYELLDNQIRLLKGWFKDTLPKAPIKQLAILRLDGDMYESTMNAG